MIPAAVGDILECAVLLVVQEKDAVVEAYGEIGRAVIVVVSGGASDGVNGRIQVRLSSSHLQTCRCPVVIQRHPALRTVVGQKNVRLAVAVIVEKASARPEK